MKNTGFGNTEYSFVFSEVGRSGSPSNCSHKAIAVAVAIVAF